MFSAPPVDNPRAALWMLASVAAATVMTVLVRELTPEMHTRMIAFLRSFVALAFLLPLLVRRDALARLRVRRPWLHLLRGALIAVALNSGFYAIWKLPLATATILFFLAPIFSTLLAPLMVGERVGPRRLIAVAVGFGGALVVLRPGVAPIDAGTAAAVLSSLCFAVSLLLGKIAGAHDGHDAVFFSSAVISALLTLPPALTTWHLPSEGWIWLAVLGLALASSLRGYADIRAFAIGEAGYIAPVSYLRLPSVGAVGYLIFGERVDFWTLLGGAIIAGATLYIVLREAALRRAGTPPPVL